MSIKIRLWGETDPEFKSQLCLLRGRVERNSRQPNGCDSALSPLGLRVPTLVEELRSCKPRGVAKI